MRYSHLCAVPMDRRISDVDAAARFWGEALGRPVDLEHPGIRSDCRKLETPPDEPIVQIQRVGHESRIHIDIETDDIQTDVRGPEQVGAVAVGRLKRWAVMPGTDGQRFCVVRVRRPGFP